MFTSLVFDRRRFFFQFRSVSVSISIIWHAGLFFRSYSGNMPAMLFTIELFTIMVVNVSVFSFVQILSRPYFVPHSYVMFSP